MVEFISSFGTGVQILFFLAGLALIVFGADYLVDGSSTVARKAGISEFVIGLTIVGMGTSTPEMVVSVLGAIQGNGDIAIGNVVGSNIFNVLLILGLTALIMPIGITPSNKKRDIPINIVLSLLLVVFGLLITPIGGGANGLTRIDGIIFLLLFAIYMWMSFKFDEGASKSNDSNEKETNIWLAILMIAGGLAALIFGGNLFVDSATVIAKNFGISDKFIAITILAGGTSMPELVTCIVAAAKKKGQLALGNIIGSNIFNVLFILGTAATIHPLSMGNMDFVDLGVLVFSSLIILFSAYSGKNMKIGRLDGAFMLLCEFGYMGWLIYNL